LHMDLLILHKARVWSYIQAILRHEVIISTVKIYHFDYQKKNIDCRGTLI